MAANYTVTVATDKSSYYQGDLVNISGLVKDSSGLPVSGAAVGIEVDKPDGSPIYVDQATTNASGWFVSSFRLPIDAMVGTYNVTATYSGEQGFYQFNVSKKIYTLSDFPAPFILSGVANVSLVIGMSGASRGPVNPANTIDVAGSSVLAYYLGLFSVSVNDIESLLDWEVAIYNSTDVLSIVSNSNVIAFGSDGVNLVHKYYFDKRMLSVWIGGDAQGLFIYSSNSGMKYRMIGDYWHNQNVTDYAFVHLIQDAENHLYVLIIAGLSGYATRGCSEWLAQLPSGLQGHAVIVKLFDSNGDGRYENITIVEIVP